MMSTGTLHRQEISPPQVGGEMERSVWRRLLSPIAAVRLLLVVVVVVVVVIPGPVLLRFLRPSLHSFVGGGPPHEQDEKESDASSISGLQGRPPEICADIDLSEFRPGRACGLPLSAPCFNSTRCASLPRPTMYVYDHNCSLADSSQLAKATAEIADAKDQIGAIWRTAVANAGLLAEKYESACLFVHVNQRFDKEPCAPGAPLWNEGSNHVMVDLTDNPRNTRRTVVSSLAIEAAVNVRTCFYRSGYDISVPLAPKSRFPKLATVHPSARRFFLAFKGTVYIAGGGGSAERMSLDTLHDPANGVAVVMHCFEVHGDQLKPENVEYCARLSSAYGNYSYGDVMNTTFALVPAGRSPASYRLGEVMSAGAIPVFVATSTVRPFAEELDWSSFSFVFSPDQAGSEMVEALRAVPSEELEIMQRKSLEAYDKLFGNSSYRYDTVARNVVEVLERRVSHHRV